MGQAAAGNFDPAENEVMHPAIHGRADGLATILIWSVAQAWLERIDGRPEYADIFLERLRSSKRSNTNLVQRR
jgi:hypothetical protein